MGKLKAFHIIPLIVLMILVHMSKASEGQSKPDYKECLKISDAEHAAICLISVGNALGEEGRYKEAEKAFREALRVSPKDWIAANAYSSLGMLLGRQGKYSEGIEALEKATRLNPSQGSAWYDLGICYFKTKSLDKAAQAFKQAILVAEIAWIIDNCYVNLCYIYLYKNDIYNAKRNYEILTERNRELAEMLSSELKGNRELWEKFQKVKK